MKVSRGILRGDLLRSVMAMAKFDDVEFCWERDEPVNPWPDGEWRWVMSLPKDKQDIYVSPTADVMRWETPNGARILSHDSTPAIDKDRPNQPLWIDYRTGETMWGDPLADGGE